MLVVADNSNCGGNYVRVTFQVLTNEQALSADVLNVTLQVNRAALHLDRRIRYLKHAYKMLSDDVTTNLPGGNLMP